MDNKKNFENSNDTVMRTVLLMSLLKNEKYTAAELAEILNCSVRHVHRMINGLKAAGIKMKIKRGRFGGFKIVDDRFHISGQMYLDTLRKLKND